MKKYLIIGIVLIVAGLMTTIVVQYRMIQEEKTKQVAIKNPTEKKAEVIEREIVKYITKEGDTKVVTKEVIKTIMEKKPAIQLHRVEKRKYYLSGFYGIRITDAWDEYGYGMGGGYNFTDWLSAGIRVDTIGQEYRIGMEVRINF